ncbi:MAG: hypothetical protein ACRCTY_05340 [Candidatus Adiutrix sp.]
MKLHQEQSALCSAGCVGWTLGRLSNSLWHLPRAHRQQARGEPRDAFALVWFYEPAQVACLDQTLRIMADAWSFHKKPWHHFDKIDQSLTILKEMSLGHLCTRTMKHAKRQQFEYQMLAQTLEGLQKNFRFCS